ncbi:histidine kinase dimerization/phosphoacceptor domain -containing protein [Gracilimonas mengyeensis]|uniref:PAS domain S-box-containing protein n=1 Tax=Gracilimonas mengyeensis TaxID=1302730 RepID=A0A521ES37_9BACT|nr:histidine kinase dimerization/phosphoacceptor domain -containing protein [Gracilimonas mengyeensis]SMO85920.1 PAS domain S-box-containing protein [Gracilimonas mengyeensis]
MTEVSVKEQLRIQALHSYGILDTEEEAEFDNLLKLAAHICDVPVAKMNFIDEDRVWSKANFGNDVKETPKNVTFCVHTIKNEEHMVVEDTTKDRRFKDSPYVIESPNIRFYAGVNIKGNGHNLGTICVLDMEPKTISEEQINALTTLAREVENRLELRKKNEDLATLTAFLEASVELMLIIDPDTGRIEKVNRNGSGLCKELFPDNCNSTLESLYPEWDFLKELKKWNEEGAETPFRFESSILNEEGNPIYLEMNTTKKFGKWLITFQDITLRKKADEELKREKKLSDAIINSLPTDFYMFDKDMKLVRWNDNMLKSTQYSSEEVQQLNPLDFFRGEDIQRVKKHIEKTMKGSISTLEANLVKKDGSTEPFLFNATSFKNGDETYLLGTGQNINAQKSYQKRLENVVHEKEVLLQEVHHRVKNNLAVISGFLQLEEFISDDEKIKSVLLANHMRVKSMALIHEELYTAKDFSGLNFQHYLVNMLQVLEDRISPQGKKITLETYIDPIYLNLNQAVPLALIINELVSNAYTFAFQGRQKGKVSVELKSQGDNISLCIKDDGIGLPDGFVFEESPTLGATLVLTYSEQINSKVDITSERNKGTEYAIAFENQKKQKGSSSNFNFEELMAINGAA